MYNLYVSINSKQSNNNKIVEVTGNEGYHLISFRKKKNLSFILIIIFNF